MHGPLKKRRIYSVSFQEEGKRLKLTVGDSFHRFSDRPILAIVQAEDGSVYVWTHSKEVGRAESFEIGQEHNPVVEDFDGGW